MSKEMSLLRGINSLRSVSKFRQDPVRDEIIRSILRAATRAASGSNAQPWEFVVVRDAKVKARLSEPMLRTWLERLGSRPRMSGRMKEAYDDATEMLRDTKKVPAIIYCCIDLNRVSKSEEVRYASILPAVQNLMLAAHAMGLGTCLTVHGSTPTRADREEKGLLLFLTKFRIAVLVNLGYQPFSIELPKRKLLDGFPHYTQC